MNTPLQFGFLWAIAFVVGSIPTAYLAGRISKGIDIRLYGSGNVGATNALRVLGKKMGVLVFTIDFLKGFLAVYFLPLLWPSSYLETPEVRLWIGTGAIMGHVFSPFLGFKGGKGIATGAGVLSRAFPFLFLIVLVVWAAVFILTRVVSVSSLMALIALVIASILLGLSTSVILCFFFMLLFLGWTHRSNISRLVQGKEDKIS